MLLRKLLLIGICIWCGLPLQAIEVVSWLKGTYTPFVTDAKLAEHKGLSPLMGAIAWHSGWIAGLYTWGVGEKQVERGAVQQQAGPAAAAPERVKITWKGNDATTELVRTLFREAGEGDIQPTISEQDLFFVIIKEVAGTDQLSLLMQAMLGKEDQEKLLKLYEGSKNRSKRKNLSVFLRLIAASREQCGPGKRYPAWVTDQIISAYYYAVQFKPQVNGGADIALWMKGAFDRYMHALGANDYVPTWYELDASSAQECPLVIDEAVLIKNLYKKLAKGELPPLANYKSFAYRGAPRRGSCVETMIHNFFNVLLYDAAKKRYTLDLLPASIKEHANEKLLAYYANETNALVANTDKQDVHDAWAEVVSGLPGGVHGKPSQSHEIEYIKGDERGLFELESTPPNVLSVINTLLGTSAKSFDELSSSLSTGRRVALQSLSGNNGFELWIHLTPLARFIINPGHSHTEPINHCAGSSNFEAMCTTSIEGKALEQLQDILLTRTGAQITEQDARYLMYDAGKNDYDWLVKMANIFCPPAHADPLFASIADKLFDRSWDALRRLHEDVLLINSPKKRESINKDLFRAVQDNFLGLIKVFIAQGVDVNAKDQVGDSVLMHAIRTMSSDAPLALIEKGADVNAKNEFGNSVLIEAIDAGLSDVALALIAKGSDINEKDAEGGSVLSRAIKRRRSDVVLALIEKGADINAKDAEGRSVLSRAVYEELSDVALALIAKGADVNENDDEGDSVLQAIDNKFPDVALALIAKGAGVNAKDAEGNSVLINAIKRRFSDVALALIAKGTDVNAKDAEGDLVLMHAINARFSDVALALIAKGTDVNAKDAEGDSVLVSAIDERLSDVALALIAKGADVNEKNKYGTSVLMNAIFRRLSDVVQALIAKGADVNAKDGHGDSVLMQAIEYGYSDVVQALIAKGADVDAAVLAYAKNTADAVQAFIAKGVDVDAAVLERAKNDADKKIIALLEQVLAQKASQRGSPEPQAAPVAA